MISLFSNMSILWYLKKLSKEMVTIKKIYVLIFGIASIFSSSNNVTDVFEKYTPIYEKYTQKSLQKSWLKVGNTLKGTIDKYGSDIKNKDKN